MAKPNIVVRASSRNVTTLASLAKAGQISLDKCLLLQQNNHQNLMTSSYSTEI